MLVVGVIMVVVVGQQLHVVRPKIRVGNQLVGAAKGTEVLLECRVEASPKPLTSWIRQDQVILLPTHKYQISEEVNTYKIKMKLKITDLEEKDFGAYKCVAKNTLGEKEGYIRLYGEYQTERDMFVFPFLLQSSFLVTSDLKAKIVRELCVMPVCPTFPINYIRNAGSYFL